jgi:hypothetical protein
MCDRMGTKATTAGWSTFVHLTGTSGSRRFPKVHYGGSRSRRQRRIVRPMSYRGHVRACHRNGRSSVVQVYGSTNGKDGVAVACRARGRPVGSNVKTATSPLDRFRAIAYDFLTSPGRHPRQPRRRGNRGRRSKRAMAPTVDVAAGAPVANSCGGPARLGRALLSRGRSGGARCRRPFAILNGASDHEVTVRV